MANTGGTGSSNASDLDAEVPGGGATALVPSSALPTPAASETPDDKTRRGISYWLLTLLSFLLVVSFVATFVINYNYTSLVNGKPVPSSPDQAEFLLKVLNIVFGPVVTLVSSVVGFYFGARTAKEGSTP